MRVYAHPAPNYLRDQIDRLQFFDKPRPVEPDRDTAPPLVVGLWSGPGDPREA